MANEFEQKPEENNAEGTAIPGTKEELKNSININLKWVHASWFFSVMFLIVGLPLFFENPIASLTAISCGLLLLPSLNKDLSWKIKLISCLAIIIANGLYQSHRNSQLDEQKQIVLKEQAELEKQLAKDFAENQESILSNARQLFDQGQYSRVIAISNKYASVHNSQLNELAQKVQVLNRQMEVNARQAEMDAVSEKYKIDMRYLCRQANSGLYENYDRAVSLCNHQVSNCRKNAGEKYESMKKGQEQMGKYWKKTDWYSVYKEDIEKCDAKLDPCSEELLKCYKKG